MGLKVLSVRDFALSHVLLIGGTVLLTLGLFGEVRGFIIGGIWAFVLGLCLVFSAAFKKLAAK